MHGAIYFLIFVFIRIVTQNLKLKTFMKFYEEQEPSKLYDIGFKYIPMTKFHFLDDILVVLPLFIGLYLKINLSNFLFILTCVYLLREITTTITLLPPTPFCFEREKIKKDKSKTLTELAGACNETIFSGHTSLMLISILFILPKITNNYIKILIYLYAITTSVIIISLRSHYTIDVVLAWVICILFYVAYFGNNIIKKMLLN